MMIDIASLNQQPRLLIEAVLRPVQGSRFQPTGFPNLGPAVYESPDGDGRIVLVESAQSMANRLEAVCWDARNHDWVAPLKGLPFVKVVDEDGKYITNSVLEAHRINSEYIARSEVFMKTVGKAIGFKKDKPFDVLKQLVPALLRFDVNSLVHGVFLEEVAGVIRLPRTLSAFIEASHVNIASSGGVKINRVEPTLKEGEGNVPFPREEYTGKIVAYFNLDLRQIRSFDLGSDVENLLIAFSLFKIDRFLKDGLRLRTACDLDVVKIDVTQPLSFKIPTSKHLKDELPRLIDCVARQDRFNDRNGSRVLQIVHKKKSKDKK